MNKIKNILIFEPWNFGDCIIAVYFARVLQQYYEINITVLCSSKWEKWVNAQPFIKNVILFDAPWTQIGKRYTIFPQDIKTAKYLFRELHNNKFDLIWDVRGDCRHYMFLKIFSSHNICSFKNKNSIYHRLNIFIRDVLNESLKYSSYSFNNNEVNKISLFFDASWDNKKLPQTKANELIHKLIIGGFYIKLIIAPGANYVIDEKLFASDLLDVINGDILSIEEEIKASDLLITTDTGWMHNAFYNGIQCIGLFGFDNHFEWAPPNTIVVLSDEYLNCNIRYKKKNFNICPLQSLDVDKVMDVISRINNNSTRIT